jgi:hypothetical protein
MRGRLHQWWALVLRHLHERPAQTPSEPGPITDDEVAQLARDSWDLYGARGKACSRVPPCPHGRAGVSGHRNACPNHQRATRRDERKLGRWAMQGRISTRLQGGCDKGHV